MNGQVLEAYVRVWNGSQSQVLCGATGITQRLIDDSLPLFGLIYLPANLHTRARVYVLVDWPFFLLPSHTVPYDRLAPCNLLSLWSMMQWIKQPPAANLRNKLPPLSCISGVYPIVWCCIGNVHAFDPCLLPQRYSCCVNGERRKIHPSSSFFHLRVSLSARYCRQILCSV